MRVKGAASLVLFLLIITAVAAPPGQAIGAPSSGETEAVQTEEAEVAQTEEAAPPAESGAPAADVPPAPSPGSVAAGTPSAAVGPAPQLSLFTDVPPEHPAARDIGALFLLGVVQGDQTGRFRPADPVTRAELLHMLLAARGIAPGETCTPRFADVSCSAWYGPTVTMAYRLALAEGRSDSRFAPDEPVTRQEALVMIVRALGKWWEARKIPWQERTRLISRYPDGPAVANWARPYLAWLIREGYLGPSDAPLRLTQRLTRAEAAQWIHRMVVPAGQNWKVAVVDGRPIRYVRAVPMKFTKYTVGEPGVNHWTYTDTRVRLGVVAVDPTVIPLGSLMYVEGYGYAVAADIGGAIKGYHVDLFTWSWEEAVYTFGMRRGTVYLIDDVLLR